MFSVVAAIAQDGAIGQGGALPWPRLSTDMRWFRAVTSAADPYGTACYMIDGGIGGYGAPATNALIMGSVTHRSIQYTLQGRHSIILTYGPVHVDAVDIAGSLERALILAEHKRAPHIFAIGGAQVFAEALAHPDCQRLYLTEVQAHYPNADTWWPWEMSLWNWQLGIAVRRDAGAWWERTRVSTWIEEGGVPLYRLSIWERSGKIQY